MLARSRRQPVDRGAGEVAQIEHEHAREVALDLPEARGFEDARAKAGPLQFWRERKQVRLTADDQNVVHTVSIGSGCAPASACVLPTGYEPYAAVSTMADMLPTLSSINGSGPYA